MCVFVCVFSSFRAFLGSFLALGAGRRAALFSVGLFVCVFVCVFSSFRVEWFFYSKRIIIVRWADLSDFFSLIFVSKMCVFVSRPMNIFTFLRKNDYTPKRVVDFPLERDTFRNKIMEIVKDFDEKSYNNNGKPWKSSRILRVNPIFSFSFFCFIIFLHFFVFFSFFHFLSFSFIFFHFPSFSIIFFHFLTCYFIFYHFLSFSIIFYHFQSFSFIFLSFSLSLLGAQNMIFLCLNFVTISLDSSYVKNQFFGPISGGRYPFGPSFPFFSYFFSTAFFLTIFFSFFVHFFIFLIF